jgi:hypothetical protein
VSSKQNKMKKIFIILSAFFVLAGCEKTNETPVIKGKLVYHSCATTVVQILDEQHYNYGQDSWRQSPSKEEFNHVFAVSNHCSFPGSVAVGEEIHFKILSDDPGNKECVTCAVFDNPPQKSQVIEVVEVAK